MAAMQPADAPTDDAPPPPTAPVPPQMLGMCQEIETDVQYRLVQSQAVVLKTMVCPLLQKIIQEVSKGQWEPGLDALLEQELPIAINAALEELPKMLSDIINNFLGEKTVDTLKRMADGTYECEFPCNCDESCTGVIAATKKSQEASTEEQKDKATGTCGRQPKCGCLSEAIERARERARMRCGARREDSSRKRNIGNPCPCMTFGNSTENDLIAEMQPGSSR